MAVKIQGRGPKLKPAEAVPQAATKRSWAKAGHGRFRPGSSSKVRRCEKIQGEGSLARNKKLLSAPGLSTRSKDTTRGSWPVY